MIGRIVAGAAAVAAVAAVLVAPTRAEDTAPPGKPVTAERPLAAAVAADTAYWALSHVLRLDPDALPAAVGRDREVLVDLGQARFLGSGAWRFEGERRRLAFTHDDAGRGSLTQGTTAIAIDGTWTERGTDGRLVVARDDAAPAPFVANASGDVVVSVREAGDDAGEVRLDVLARRPAAGVDVRDVAGRFWFGFLETSAVVDGSVTGDAYSAFGLLVLKRNGKASVAVVSSDGTDTGVGAWQIAGDEAGILAGSVTLSLDLDVGGTRTFTVLPGADLDVILGADRGPMAGAQAVIVGVRQGRRLSNRRVRGTLTGMGIEIWPFERRVPLPDGGLATTLDLELDDYQVQLDFDGSRTLTVRHAPVRMVRRDRRAGRGASARLLPRRPNTTAFYLLSRDGLVQALDGGIPLLGAVSPDATFAFVVDDPRDGDDLAGLELIVRPAEGVR